MFEGFTPDTQNFLWELSFHNERVWFSAHKEEFERNVNTPFKELGRDTFALMQQKFPELGLELHLSRIYRDARRLFGRGPYKDHLWFSIMNRADGYNGPSFYFEISPRGYCYGMGYYSEKSGDLEAFRKAIETHPEQFRALAEDIAADPALTLQGPEYKRKKGDFGPVINPWYNRKYIFVDTARDYDDQLCSRTLPGILVKTFEKLMPMYEFINTYPREIL